MTEDLEIDFTGNKLAICIPTYSGQLPVGFVNGLLTSVIALRAMGCKVDVYYEYGNALVQSARDRLVHKALQNGATKIMFIDSDILFTDNDVMRVVGFSTLYPIVAGAYVGRQDPPTFIVGLKDMQDLQWNEHGLLEVESLGFGFVVIDSSVFEAMETKARKYKDTVRGSDVKLNEYFRVGVVGDTLLGEDIFFFDNARKLGFGVVVDTDLELKHLGAKEYVYSLRKVLKDKQRAIIA